VSVKSIGELLPQVLESHGIIVPVLKVYFDGACEPTNPGGVATYGWLIVDHEGKIVASGHGEVCRGAKATNNVAEWCALGFALRWVDESKIKSRLEIFGDSQLVVKQLSGAWRVNKPHLQAFKDRCLELLACRNWVANWIPREQNEAADKLSQKAYTEATGKPFPERRR